MGLTSCKIRVRNGQVFAALSPGPLSSSDLAHVALARETGGARLSDESSPSVFPYLQLVPPHCFTCQSSLGVWDVRAGMTRTLDMVYGPS